MAKIVSGIFKTRRKYMISDANMYAEVFEILGCMDKQEVMRIPVNVIEYIKKERSKTYQTRIDKNDLFNPNNIDNRTVNLLAWLMIEYMANEEQREKIIKRAKENDQIKEEEKKQKYNSVVFGNKKDANENIEIAKDEVKEESSIVIVEEETIIGKVIKFFKNFFKK